MKKSIKKDTGTVKQRRKDNPGKKVQSFRDFFITYITCYVKKNGRRKKTKEYWKVLCVSMYVYINMNV